MISLKESPLAGAVLILMVGLCIGALAFLVLAPDLVLANLDGFRLVSLQSLLRADYSMDPRGLVVQPLDMRVIGEAISERATSEVRQQATQAIESLKTPVFTITPFQPGLNTPVPPTNPAPVQTATAFAFTLTGAPQITPGLTTGTVTPTPTASLTPTRITLTPAASITATPKGTPTPVNILTPSLTPSPSATRWPWTVVATLTLTPTATFSPTATFLNPTLTFTPTPSPTSVPSRTFTAVPPTSTFTPTSTATATRTPTSTATSTRTPPVYPPPVTPTPSATFVPYP